MSRKIKYTPEVIEELFNRSAPMMQRHAATVHVESDFIYSGVYAKSFGYEGILTAGHCANDFLEAPHIALSIAEEKHQLWVEPSAFEHVRIGYDVTEGYTSSGPDLSFVIIQDKNLLGVIKSQNFEFYDLDHYRTKVAEVFTPDTDNFNWCVEGNPGEKIEVKKEFVGGTEHTITLTTDAIVQGNFFGCQFRDEFDYIKILLGSGFEGFPDSYKGVSGGGIWYQRFVTKDEKNYDVEPMLAGIACCQGTQRKMDDYKVRIIEGHGWVSIYGHVRRALAEKRASYKGQ